MNPKVVVPLALFAVVLVVGLFLIQKVFEDPHDGDPLAICFAPLPQDRKGGLSASIDEKGSATINLNGEVGQPNVPTEAQLKAFTECVRRLTPTGEVEITNAVILPPEPLGQVANRWDREPGGPKLALIGSDPRLSLVRFGEARGTKAEVIRSWCAATSVCVTCDPADPNEETVQVNVSLKADAPLERTEMPGEWPVPPEGSEVEPWQDIDKNGKRYYFECKAA